MEHKENLFLYRLSIVRPLRPIIYDACFFLLQSMNACTTAASMLDAVCIVFIKVSEIVRFNLQIS